MATKINTQLNQWSILGDIRVYDVLLSQAEGIETI